MDDGWKKWFWRSAGFGAGLAVVLVLSAGIFIWWSSLVKRPKPWNTSTIKGTYTVLTAQVRGDDLHFTFTYGLNNPTDTDYYLPDSIAGELMKRLPGGKGFQKLNASSWGERVIVPAKQTVNVEFDVPIHLEDFNKKAADLESDADLSKFINRRLSDMDGLVFFDYTHRYRIDLPNGWPESMKGDDQTSQPTKR